MRNIFFINVIADLPANGEFSSSWNNFVTPKLFQESFELKEIKSTFINFNELFLDEILSEKFIPDLISSNNKKINNLEKKDSLSSSELNKYLFYKFIKSQIDNKGQEKFFEKLRTQKHLTSRIRNSLFEDYDIIQVGDLKIQPKNKELEYKNQNFGIVFKSILKQFDFSNSVIIFPISTKVHMSSTIQTSKIIKSFFPDCTIIVGGPFVKSTSKSFLDELVNKDVVDIYIKEDSEKRCYGLLDKVKQNEFKDFRGEWLETKEITINDFLRTKKDDGTRTTILLSNGCYYGKCKYCEFTAICSKFVIKEISVVADEIENLYNQGERRFTLMSDSLVPVYGVKLAKEIIKRKLDISWHSAFLRIDPAYTKEVIKILAKSGFRFDGILIGMESPVDAALEFINKGYTEKIITSFFKNFNELGIKIGRVNCIFDLPKITPDDVPFIKEFIINLYDTVIKISGEKLYMPIISEFALNPEKYGIELFGLDQTYAGDVVYSYKMKEDTLGSARPALANFFNLINLVSRFHNQFPNVDVNLVARTNIYNELKYRLKFKINSDFQETISLFDKEGKKNPKKYIFQIIQKKFHH